VHVRVQNLYELIEIDEVSSILAMMKLAGFPNRRQSKLPGVLWAGRAVAAGLPILLLLGGCTRESHKSNVFREAMTGDVSTLDPALAYDTKSIPWVRLIYRGLVDYDDGANIVNEVARQHEITPDGKTYRFKLRKDVYFHSGRRVVAEDFRFALERVLDPATASDGLGLPGYLGIVGAPQYIDAIKKLNTALAAASSAADKASLRQRKRRIHVAGIEVRGDDEIIYHLKEPDATFLNYLALPFAYALPREAVDRWGKAISEHPDGCGPYFLKEWVHDARMVLEKNPHYFHPDLPKCPRIEIYMDNSSVLQMMRFERGDTDVLNISDAYPPDFLRIIRDPKWQPYMQHAPMMDIRYLCMNTELPPFDNVLVRRAFNYAINRKTIAGFLTGRATIARGALPPGMPAYNPNLFQYPFDPDKARSLLKQANYRDDKDHPLVLWYSDAEPWYEKAAQSMQQDLQNVGVTIALKNVRYSELKAAAGKRRNLKLSIMGWLQDFPDPSDFLDVLFNKSSITENSSQNRAFYSNPRVNALLDQAKVELNRERRLQLYQQAEAIIVQDAPWVFLHHTERYVVHQPWVTGYTLHPMWSERLEYVGVGH
jgi:ABC-type transport system substrate-binding protein